MRTRKLRAGLSALGIAIGVAAVVAVLGLAASSQAAVLNEIAQLGTNLLTVSNGQNSAGGTAELPATAPGMIARLPGVTQVQDTGTVSTVNAYKSPLIPAVADQRHRRGRGDARAARRHGHRHRPGPVPERRDRPRAGRGARRYHRAALGHRPGPPGCKDLGRPQPGARHVVLRGGHPSAPAPPAYAPQIDSAVLIGFPAAERYLHFDGNPSVIYVRTTPNDPAATTRVDSLLAAQASPENPGQVTVSQPSAALAAQADVKGALDTLFLGLGAVALLVGAIGVANIMIISVLERRQEIGLRRALGATRGQIRVQFLAEAIMLSLAGGAVGVIVGAATVTAYARTHGEAVVIPLDAWAGGLAAAVIIGALAGLLPAIRAARLSPDPGALEHLTKFAVPRLLRDLKPIDRGHRPAGAVLAWRFLPLSSPRCTRAVIEL